MRFLCLHGMGTNSQILEAQLSPILSHFQYVHEFVFLDGLVECEAAPGISPLFSGPYYSYYSQPTASQLRSACSYIEDIIEEEGPFDGVIGFSQGAALAASMLLRYQKHNPHAPVFRLGIFAGASLPYDLSALDQEIDRDHDDASSVEGKNGRTSGTRHHCDSTLLHTCVSIEIAMPNSNTATCSNSSPHSYSIFDSRHSQPTPRANVATPSYAQIQIPTLHLIGRKDEYNTQSHALARLCDRNSIIVMHDAGHEVPRDRGFVGKVVEGLEEVVRRALQSGFGG